MNVPRRFVFVLLAASTWVTSVSTADEDLGAIRIRISKEFIYGANPHDALAGLEAYAEALAGEMAKRWKPLRWQIRISANLAEMQNEFEAGEIELAHVSCVEYVRLRDSIGVVPILTAGLTGTGGFDRAQLVVRSDEPATSISELKGKTFIYVNEGSATGYLFPQWLLCRSRLPEVGRFFGRTIQVSKEKSAIYAVLLGEGDVVSASKFTLDTLAELSPSMRAKLKVIATSDPIPRGVLVARRDLDPQLLKGLPQWLGQSEGVSEKLRHVSTIYRLGSLRPCTDEDLEPTRQMLRIIEEHEKRHIDPICGARLSDLDAQCSLEVAGETLRFCSQECRRKFQDYRERAGKDGKSRLVLLGLSRNHVYEERPGDALKMIQKLLDMITSKSSREFVAIYLPNFRVGCELIREGTLSLIQCSGPAYLKFREAAGIQPLVRTVTSDESFRVVLVTSRNDAGGTFSSLRGRTLAMAGGEESAIELYVRSLLRQAGARTLSDYFGAVIHCPSEESALRAVSYGHADAAFVKSTTFEVLEDLSPSLQRNLKRAEATSEPMLTGPVCVRRDADPGLREEVRRLLLELVENEEHRSFFTYFRIRQIVKVKDSDYEGLRRFMKREPLEKTE